METHMSLDSHVKLAEKYPPRNLELPSLYHNISIRAQLTTFLASNMGGILIEKDVDQSSMEKRSAASHPEDDDEESEIGDNEDELTLESLLQQSKSARRPMAISETMRNTAKFGNVEILLRSKLPYSCLYTVANDPRRRVVGQYFSYITRVELPGSTISRFDVRQGRMPQKGED
jgi:hypothetical protein